MLASLILAASLWPTQLIQLCSPESNTKILGIAKSPTGDFLYCEKIDASTEHDLNIFYINNGKKFAEKKINYATNPAIPAVEQTDSRSGEVRVAEINQQMLSLQYQASKKDKLLHTDIPLTKVDVVDAGFDYFIRQHWDELQSGKVLSVNFASIAHQKVLPLRVRKLEAEKCIEKSNSEENPYCYFVEIDNAFLRLVLGNIKLAYDEQHRLKKFNGVVNIESESGSTQTAIISYYYKKDYLNENISTQKPTE